MTHKKLDYYRLANEAETDLDSIFDYTEEEHGFDQAVKYLSDLDDLFEQLVKSPDIGRERKELKPGVFSIVGQQHIVFYQIKNNYILIVRVLHGHRDIPKYL